MTDDTGHLRAIHWWIRLFGVIWVTGLAIALGLGAVALWHTNAVGETSYTTPVLAPAMVTTTTSPYQQCVAVQHLQAALPRMWQTDHRNCLKLDGAP
jgi:hypothetical protein